MANANEYKSTVGLRDLYIAAVTEDSLAAYTAGTPQYLAPAASASSVPKQSFSTQYADDGAFDAINAEAETTIDLEVTAIPLETLALISGKVFDVATGRVFDNAGIPGYFALGFRSLKASGGYRYFWFLKGRFDAPSEELVTKGETAEPKTQKLKFTAVKTVHQFALTESLNDGAKRTIGDTDTTNFSATGWFSQVQVPGAVAPDALALSSSVPTADATGINVTANITLTYNNALKDAAINGVTLIASVAGTAVAGAVTLDATKKIITVNPTASLSANTLYRVVAAVTDVFGQTLTSIVSFTTAP